MKILFIGDIVGRPGRDILKTLLSDIIKKNNIDLCIANGENTAGGMGLTPVLAKELFSIGVNAITSGNHIWDKREIYPLLDRKDSNIIRPANYPAEALGHGSMLIDTGLYEKVGIINLSGRVFIDNLDCPFKAAINEIQKLKPYTKTIIVDMHAEATSEKIALGWYLDGKVSAVLGTHTHVQTADEKILPNNTAYITDVGMTGPVDSVIGVKKEIAINKFITHMPNKFEPAKGRKQLNAVIVDIDYKTGLSSDIQRVFEVLE